MTFCNDEMTEEEFSASIVQMQRDKAEWKKTHSNDENNAEWDAMLASLREVFAKGACP